MITRDHQSRPIGDSSSWKPQEVTLQIGTVRGSAWGKELSALPDSQRKELQSFFLAAKREKSPSKRHLSDRGPGCYEHCLCLVSLVGGFLLPPTPPGRAYRRRSRKRNVAEHLARELSSKELLFDSWQRASRQMVFEKKRAAGRCRFQSL